MSDADEYADCILRVRYGETDQMGVAYYANYLVWFEVGRAEFCRQRGFSYAEMEKATKRFLMVAEAHCRYQKPLRYDEEFVVRTRMDRLRRRTVTFTYQLLSSSKKTLLAEGETTHVVTDVNGKARDFPPSYRELLEGVSGVNGGSRHSR